MDHEEMRNAYLRAIQQEPKPANITDSCLHLEEEIKELVCDKCQLNVYWSPSYA